MPIDDEGERMDIGDVYSNRTPREKLEDEIVLALKSQGAIPQRSRGVQWWGLAAVAAGLMFSAGWGASRMTAPAATMTAPGATQDGQPPYMLLLWQGPGFQNDPAHRVEYEEWGRTANEGGTPVFGDELGLPRRVFGPPNRSNGADLGPASEYLLGGYFMVTAGEEEALRLAEGHPHRSHGGWVEVAPVVPR